MINDSFKHPAWIEIDLKQFKKNIEILKKRIGTTKFCLPVKANAYGHGLLPIAKAAIQAKIDYLAVSCLQEGILLREAGIELPILVFGAIHEDQIPDLLNYSLEITIASLYKAKLVAKYCDTMKKKSKIHIEIDTGMQRTGVKPTTAIELLNYIYSEQCFDVVGIYSHFASSDEPKNPLTKLQLNQFKYFIDNTKIVENKNIIFHIANSGGICYFPDSYLNMVRPGLISFGYIPGPYCEDLKEIKPILSIKAKIAYFKVVPHGQGISYNHTYITKEQTRIVTIPLGYGDGLRRDLSNCGEVLIRGKRYTITGNICMDQFMVDIHNDEAYVGEEVVILGKQGNEQIKLQEIATLCHTITYEILCGFNNRLPRFYID